MNENYLDRYAQILVQHALGLRPGQRLDVWGELIHRDFALRIGEAAYSAGAGQVRYRLVDPLEAAQLIRRASPEQIALHYLENRGWLDDVLRTRGALLVLVGKGDPKILAELQREHPRNHELFAAESNAVSLELTRRVVDQQICPASTAICPTPAWARAVFPELSEADAHQRFWTLLCEWTGADRDDATAHVEASARVLMERAHTLDALEIRELRLQGGGCDLRVGLSAASRWQSGALSTARASDSSSTFRRSRFSPPPTGG
ncbi:MAG: aminopeptidase [Thermoanaerobaculia bacterium]|nr:aminopeptidase [Thermoanaerobaculia bacterium]